MNSVLASQPFSAPHLHPYPDNNRLSPTRSSPFGMASRKRKAEDDLQPADSDMSMSASPSSSPSIPSRGLPRMPMPKRTRTNAHARPLTLPRLLEALSADEMRMALQAICDKHPEIASEVSTTVPKPNGRAALGVLHNYESGLRSAFPFGGRESSDYAYNRVRQPLINLLDALQDYTPHFLPPNETQAATSLDYLDGATDVIHRLPQWDSFQNNRHKHDAYEEMAKAWALVIREAAKRGGGIQLQYGGWDQKLAKHNETSGGKMEEAVNELRVTLGWLGGNGGGQQGTPQASGQGDMPSIRQQLLNGTYGIGSPVRVGPW
ncbi:nuclear envelope protein Cut8 [Aulographum hederae CBS 113979]|uniref:Tethering factor for nuclear proteasome STS1 n=1 Tax=Aulographum hederae CBS 113979 TaxID=1176131 RepID=A0A6G1HDF3_9PEZI|nr:nuclear envelope protein Cut8 [Aulographum hederae CBS 113979]